MLSLLWYIVFMQDNVPFHFAKTTQTLLGSYGLQGKGLVVWPLASPGLGPIENLWCIIKQDLYAIGRQFTSKDVL